MFKTKFKFKFKMKLFNRICLERWAWQSQDFLSKGPRKTDKRSENENKKNYFRDSKFRQNAVTESQIFNIDWNEDIKKQKKATI